MKIRAAFYQDFPIVVEQLQSYQQEVNDRLAQATIVDQYRNDIIAKLAELSQYISSIQQAIS